MTERALRWRRLSPGVLLLIGLAYLPSLTAKPGRMPTDTKLYLYLNPGRLIADAPFSWDTRQFAGWVPHQTIAYLWPSGPWFWVFDRLGVPDWVAHRLWIGTILFLGGLGVRWAATRLGLAPTAATVAGAVYMTSPYILPYVSRTSLMLLPWMGLGWLVGLTVRAASRRSWRDVALFGLVVLTIGPPNAAALALVAPAPLLWLVHAAWQRSITWRRACITSIRLGGISLLVSLWWIVMLLVQGHYGADVLAFSETLDAVSLTSVSTETLRGLGYWLFYVRDPYAFTTTASIEYMGSVKLIVLGYLLVTLCIAGLALVRWSQRRFAVWMVVSGIVLAVGVHPIDHPSPLMRPLADSAVGLALRSSTRALPLSTFGLALGAGALVTAIGVVRIRWRPIGAAALVVLAVLGLPAMWTGGYVDPALERDQDVPAAWSDAAAALDGSDLEARVLQLPGAEFGAFTWGYTVDPPLPGLTDKPFVSRDLLPLGSPGAMDLLYALDSRFQEGTIDPAAIAPVARLLAADTIWVPNDLAFDRFRTPRPEVVAALFAGRPSGLGAPVPYGAPQVNSPVVPMLDEQALSDTRLGAPLAPVQLVAVDDAQRIVRAGGHVVVLAGSGAGVVDAAAAGLLRGDETVVYAADLDGAGPDADALRPGVPAGAPLIVTDSNRDRASQWRGSQDVSGFTETGGPDPGVTQFTSADQRLAVFATVDARHQTTVQLDRGANAGIDVRASEYGEPFAYRPEDRAAMAVDGDSSTAWRVSDRFDPVGQSITLSTTDGVLQLVQQQRPEANRRIGRIRVESGSGGSMTSQEIDLDDRSLAVPGQRVEVVAGVPVTLTIESVVALANGTDAGPSAVGFAELGPIALETTHLPAASLTGLTGDRPVAIVLSRLRVRATDRWRSDPEAALVRAFTLPVARTFDVSITLRRDDRAPDSTLARLEGRTGTATASARLAGVPAASGAAALDGDPSTAWTTPFGSAVGSSLRIPLNAAPSGESTIELTQPTDGRHSSITSLTVVSASGSREVAVPVPDADGHSTVALGSISGDSVTLTIGAIEPRTTIDRRYGESTVLPAAVTEITGLPVAEPQQVTAADCRTDLLTIDGQPLGVRVADPEALASGSALEATLCNGALDLTAGDHLIEAAPGTTTGIDVDRITLRSGISGLAATAAGASSDGSTRPTVRIERTRTTRTATVGPCPQGCWLVLGEGHDPAWHATLDGSPLAGPAQVNGGFNGWWLPPSDAERTVMMTWTPQRTLNLALVAAGAAVLACVVLAVVGHRRRGDDLPLDEPDLALDRPATARRRAVIAAGVLVVASAVAISPSFGLVAVLPAAVVVWRRRPADLGFAAAALAGTLGLVVAWRERQERYFLNAGWPGHFEDLHGWGLFVVVLLLAAALLDDQPRASDTIAGASTDEATS